MKHLRLQTTSVVPRGSARREYLAGICMCAAAMFGPSATARADDQGNGGAIRIMTQNLYEGTNFTEIASATSPGAFLGAVTLTYQNILATLPAVRAAAVASEIARE